MDQYFIPKFKLSSMPLHQIGLRHKSYFLVGVIQITADSSTCILSEYKYQCKLKMATYIFCR